MQMQAKVAEQLLKAGITAIMLLTLVANAHATTGGPETIINVYIAKDSADIIYEYGEGPVYAAMPYFYRLAPSDVKPQALTDRPASLTPIAPLEPQRFGLRATIEPTWTLRETMKGVARADGSILDIESDYSQTRGSKQTGLRCRESVSLFDGETRIGRFEIFPCCYTVCADHLKNVSMRFYAYPDRAHLLVVIDYVGLCYEGGYYTSEAFSVPFALPARNEATAMEGAKILEAAKAIEISIPKQAKAFVDLMFSIGKLALERKEYHTALGYMAGSCLEAERAGLKPQLTKREQASLAVKADRFDRVYAYFIERLKTSKDCMAEYQAILEDDAFSSMKENGKMMKSLQEIKRLVCNRK